MKSSNIGTESASGVAARQLAQFSEREPHQVQKAFEDLQSGE